MQSERESRYARKPVGGTTETYTVRCPETPSLPLVYINMAPGRENLNRDLTGNTLFRATHLEIVPWKEEIRGRVDWKDYDELPGGYSNLVLKSRINPAEVRIIWRETDHWPAIMRAVLLEDAVARFFPHQTDGQSVKGRQLLDPDRPLEVTSSGLLVSKVNILEGELRYPWNTGEIASAAKAMARIHQYLRHTSFDPQEQLPARPDHQEIQADFTRGNALFKQGTADVAAVIDYERTRKGSIEECLARTASYVLADSKLLIPGRDPEDIFAQYGRVPTQDDYNAVHPYNIRDIFRQRWESLVGTYNGQVRDYGGIEADLKEVIGLTVIDLAAGRFGDLDPVAEMALRWLQDDYEPPSAGEH